MPTNLRDLLFLNACNLYITNNRSTIPVSISTVLNKYMVISLFIVDMIIEILWTVVGPRFPTTRGHAV